MDPQSRGQTDFYRSYLDSVKATRVVPRIGHPWANSAQSFATPLHLKEGRVRGKLSTYRTGWIVLAPEGLLLSGKAVPAGGGTTFAQLGLHGLLHMALGPFAVFTESAVQQAFWQPRQDAVPWECVEEIVLHTRSRRACLVYHLPNAPKKPLSLGVQFSSVQFTQFSECATSHLGAEKVRAGKIGPPTPWSHILLVIIFGLPVVLIVAELLFIH